MPKAKASYLRRLSAGVLVAYITTVVTILLTGAAAYFNAQSQEQAIQRIVHVRQILGLINQLQNTLLDAETGQRGYLLTGKLEFLQPYWAATGQEKAPYFSQQPPVTTLLTDLQAVTENNPNIQSQLPLLRRLIDEKIGELKQTIRLYDAGKHDESFALVRSEKGKQTMDAIRVQLQRMRTAVHVRLQDVEQDNRSSYKRAYISVGLSVILSAAALAALLVTLRYAAKRTTVAETRLHRFIDSDVIGVVIADIEGDIEYANDEYLRIIGHTREAISTRNVRWDNITPDEWLEVDRHHIDEARRSGFSRRYEKEYIRPDGVRVPVMVGFAFTDDARRDVLAFVLDLTAQKQAQAVLQRQDEQLQRESRQKDEFIAVLAHELRNPLAPIRAGVDLMNLLPELPASLVNTRNVMDRQLTHLVRLIDDLLDISRINAGKLQLKLERIEVKAVIEAVLEASEAYIASSGHSLDIRLPSTPIFVRADIVRTAQILSNLLNNSAKYTHAPGRIELAVYKQGDMAVFDVKDNGIGIEPEMQQCVFDMFTQADHGQNLRKGGIGIGLPLTRMLVQLHGGEISLQTQVHAGTTITVRLPIDTTQEPRLVLRSSSLPLGLIAGKRVLILDDNVDAAFMLGELLQVHGHQVRYAHTGKEALGIVRDFKPEVAFLDIGLPDIDGYEMARAIRNISELQNTKLVALTGWGAPRDKTKAQSAGFDWHLTKPARMDEILAVLPELG